MIYIPLDGGLVSLVIGNYEDAAFIFAVFLFNARLGMHQEQKAIRGGAGGKMYGDKEQKS